MLSSSMLNAFPLSNPRCLPVLCIHLASLLPSCIISSTAIAPGVGIAAVGAATLLAFSALAILIPSSWIAIAFRGSVAAPGCLFSPLIIFSEALIVSSNCASDNVGAYSTSSSYIRWFTPSGLTIPLSALMASSSPRGVGGEITSLPGPNLGIRGPPTPPVPIAMYAGALSPAPNTLAVGGAIFVRPPTPALTVPLVIPARGPKAPGGIKRESKPSIAPTYPSGTSCASVNALTAASQSSPFSVWIAAIALRNASAVLGRGISPP